MNKKVYKVFNAQVNKYLVRSDLRTSNREMYALTMALDGFDHELGVECEIDKDLNTVVLYFSEDIKQLADDLSFANVDYNNYFDERWEEMPKVVVTLANWKSLQQKWKELLDSKPLYVVFTSVKGGEYDKVDVFGKDELSEEDWAYIKQEHAKYLKYQEAKEKYIENHPDYSEVWRGPQDDEYEADIMKYYDQD